MPWVSVSHRCVVGHKCVVSGVNRDTRMVAVRPNESTDESDIRKAAVKRCYEQIEMIMG